VAFAANGFISALNAGHRGRVNVLSRPFHHDQREQKAVINVDLGAIVTSRRYRCAGGATGNSITQTVSTRDAEASS
jgi:hypothetical protein